MADLDDVIVALAARIRAGMGTDQMAGRVFANPPDSPDPPCAIVLPSPGDFIKFDVAFKSNESDEFELVVKILMGSQDERTGLTALQGYLSRSGSTSVRAAILGDRTLGSTVSDTVVIGAQSYGDVEWAGQIFFGAELVVQAFT